jgi:large subunit ribosomal protein L35
MPKMKSVRGAVKRFKKTKNKIKRGSAYRSHILTKKSTKRMRGLKESQYISKADEGLIKILLCDK